MKPLKLILVLTILFAFNLNGFCQQLTHDQKINYKSGNLAEWSPALDAIIAAPKNHKVLMENDMVRVLEVTIAPGEVENLHHHKWPSVVYIQEAGDFTDSDTDGNIIFDSRDLKESLKLPMTMWKDPEKPHTVTNLSRTQFLRLIRMEIKR
jgi:hypothetical protein